MLPPVPSIRALTLFNSKVAIAVAEAQPAAGVGLLPPPLLPFVGLFRAFNVITPDNIKLKRIINFFITISFWFFT
jgi:hypothetical protein